MKTTYVKRHSIWTMLDHWVIALSGLLLFVTAGMMKGDEMMVRVHLLLGLVFTASVLFHILRNVLGGHFAALMKKGDICESVQIIKAMFTGGEEPASGKFLAEQRVTYTGVGIVCIGLIISGFIAVATSPVSDALREGPYAGEIPHIIFAVLFLLAFIAHMVAFIFRVNRPLFPSMFTGSVRRDYAKNRHGLWSIDGEKNV